MRRSKSDPRAAPAVSRAIVILGAAVWPGERASPALQRRVNKAIALWRTGRFELIVPSGGLGRHPPTEAELMRRLLLENGVPDAAILPEVHSKSTFTNAAYSVALLNRHRISRATVVTDNYHRLRSYLSFRRFGCIGVRVVSASDSPPYPDLRVNLRQWLRECAALPVYLVRLYLLPLPRLPDAAT